MKIQAHTNIKWVSAAGEHTGVVTNVVLAPNALNNLVPWLDVKMYQTITANEKRTHSEHTVRLCGAHENLKALRVEVI